MNSQLNQKFEYWDIIQYGIESIGKEVKISDIKEVLKGRTKVVVDDINNTEVWAINNEYLGQEHLCLSFEDNKFYGLMDFDLMPKDQSIISLVGTKRLVNFKAQIFGKSFLLWRTPLIQSRMEVYLNLKEHYGLPNDFSLFNKEKKNEFEKASKLLRETLESFGAHFKDIYMWYIEKEGIYYLASFYSFRGKKEVQPYLSFAITEMFKFNE